jgi:hypothetical protein
MTLMIRLNVEATFRLTYKILKRFMKQGFGHIINIKYNPSGESTNRENSLCMILFRLILLFISLRTLRTSTLRLITQGRQAQYRPLR